MADVTYLHGDPLDAPRQREERYGALTMGGAWLLIFFALAVFWGGVVFGAWMALS